MSQALQVIMGDGERDVSDITDVRALAEIARKVGMPADGDFHSNEIGEMVYETAEMAYSAGNTPSQVLAALIVATCRFSIIHGLPGVREWPEIVKGAIDRKEI